MRIYTLLQLEMMIYITCTLERENTRVYARNRVCSGMYVVWSFILDYWLIILDRQ